MEEKKGLVPPADFWEEKSGWEGYLTADSQELQKAICLNTEVFRILNDAIQKDKKLRVILEYDPEGRSSLSIKSFE